MFIDELAGYRKDLKALRKKYPSLPNDMEVIKKILKIEPLERPPFSFRISHMGIDSPRIIKVKKIACRSLKGRGAHSGLRLVYAYDVHEHKITFVELFHKAQKPIEDRDRILRHFL